jgi:hypothetical protein
MNYHRRNFLKATAAVSVAGASQAQAQTSDPWIGLVHSTALDSDLELAFFAGLRQKNFESDPTLPVPTGFRRLNVLANHVNGRYKKGSVDNIRQAVKDITDAIAPTQLKAIVALGGLIVGQAAAQELVSEKSTVPLATIIGRKDTGIESYANAGGYYLDDTTTATQMMAAKVQELLTYMTAPAMDAKNIWLLYNGNSAMGADERLAWNTLLSSTPYNVTQPKSVDALSTTGGTNENKDIKLRIAFNQAKTNGAQAIVVSSDPYFTRHLQRMVRIAGTQRYSSLIMCYPLMEYHDEASDAQMTSNNYFATGPRLSDVYTKLGALVGDWINGTAPNPLFKRADVFHS